ncbi:hypothetical protein K3495_g15339, partial [Podosphaera aphanis]
LSLSTKPAVNPQFYPYETALPDIVKYDGKSDIVQFVEDLEAKFFLQPYTHPTDYHKVMVAIQYLEGAKNDQTSDAPKEWARLELRMNPDLKDNWKEFVNKLYHRYQNPLRRLYKVRERQTLCQERNTVQWYKQRFELLCYETDFPKQVWGEEFYKGLSLPLKEKLSGVAFLDYRNYDLLTQYAIQLDEVYLMRQREKLSNEKIKSDDSQTYTCQPLLIIQNSSHRPVSNSFPSSSLTNAKTKITQEIKNYRKINKLCMFDGCNYPTHLCPKLIKKCKKEGKPIPMEPATDNLTTRNSLNSPPNLKNSLMIASFDNNKPIEIEGEIEGAKTKFLVDGAAQVNACVAKVMDKNPNRNKIPLNKSITTFNGKVAVSANESYESPLYTNIPGLSKGYINFVEAPIQSHTAILGIPWLEQVNPDIDWSTKTVHCRESNPTHPDTNTYTPEDIVNDNEGPIIDEILELRINSLLSEDAQAENDEMKLPNNLEFMQEVFSKSSAAKLPPHREGIDMTIDIPDGKLPRIIPMSRLS